MRFQVIQFDNGMFGVLDTDNFITLVYDDGTEFKKPYCVCFGLTKERAESECALRNSLYGATVSK